MTRPARSAPANSQYRIVGFHLMKVSSWNQIVAPPKITITARLIHSIGSTRRPRAEQPADLADRRDDGDGGGQQDGRLVGRHPSVPDQPAQHARGERQRLRRKRRRELERREEQDDREQVEQQLHQAPLSVGVGIVGANGIGSNFSDAELMQ